MGDDQHVYVDRYTRDEVTLLVWLTCASVADLGLTLVHLQQGGGEANPIMDWFLVHGGTAAFVAAKLSLTAIPALFLLIHARFRGTRLALYGLAGMYALLMVYHAIAAWDRMAV